MPPRILLYIAIAAGLNGCGTVEIRQKPGEILAFESHAYIPAAVKKKLADAPSCCESLAQLPYQNMASAGVFSSEINVESPAYPFATGKSFFSAYKIKELPRPIIVEVASYLATEPGTLANLLNLGGGGTLPFSPVMLILDEQFHLQRTIGPTSALSGCELNQNEGVYLNRFEVVETPAQASYLIILTTNALLEQDGDKVCKIIRHGLSPIGKLSVTIKTIDYQDGEMRSRSPWKWYPDKSGNPGLFAGFFQEPGLLILGNSALHFLEADELRYVERLNIPYIDIISAKQTEQSDRYLSLTTRNGSGTGYTRHSFESWAMRGETVVYASTLVSQLNTKIPPDTVVEKIAFTVQKNEPVVEFLARDTGAAARIGDAAMSGGMVTAIPCGVCQTGACSPAVLLPCTALFSVGAVIGGSVGLGKELIASLDKDAQQSASIAKKTKQSVTPIVESTQSRRFDHTALSRCIEQELGERWHDQGRMAVLSGMSTMDTFTSANAGSDLEARGYQYSAQSKILKFSLVPEGLATPEIPVHLVIEGEVQLTRFASHAVKIATVSWQSPPHKLQDWIKNGPELAGDAMKQGCDALAKQITGNSQHLWQQE
jgi:uncharacterized protein YceK